MNEGRGRRRKVKDPKLLEIVDAIRIAFVNEDKEALFIHLMRLKQSSEEGYQSENLDKILSSEFKLKKTSKDTHRTLADQELVKRYYKKRPEIFGFKSIEDYELQDYLSGDALLDLLTLADKSHSDSGEIRLGDGSHINVETLARIIETRQSQLEKNHSNISGYSACIHLGIPRADDIARIVNSEGLSQNESEGDALAKRLRKLIKEHEARIGQI